MSLRELLCLSLGKAWGFKRQNKVFTWSDWTSVLGFGETLTKAANEGCAHHRLTSFSSKLALWGHIVQLSPNCYPWFPRNQYIFTHLDKGLNLSYQNSELDGVLERTSTGCQKTEILVIPLAQDLVNSAPCTEKVFGVSFQKLFFLESLENSHKLHLWEPHWKDDDYCLNGGGGEKEDCKTTTNKIPKLGFLIDLE